MNGTDSTTAGTPEPFAPIRLDHFDQVFEACATSRRILKAELIDRLEDDLPGLRRPPGSPQTLA